MVKLARKVNKKRASVEGRQVTIVHASVAEIPIDSNGIDFVTAFETVQFWRDLGKAFSEVMRVLKDGGTFLIINRYPKEGSSW